MAGEIVKNNLGKEQIQNAIELAEKELVETEEMISLREEAGELGEESNELFGVRNDGYFNLQHDFLGFGWMILQYQHIANSIMISSDGLKS